MAYCKKCKKQHVGSTILWKPKLCNYKSHIKKNVRSCKIATHFNDECCDEEIPSSIKRLSLLTSGLTCNQIEYLLLKKEKLWFGTLVR